MLCPLDVPTAGAERRVMYISGKAADLQRDVLMMVEVARSSVYIGLPVTSGGAGEFDAK